MALPLFLAVAWNPAVGVPLLVVSVVVLLLIWLTGKPKRAQAWRRSATLPKESRLEPTLDDMPLDHDRAYDTALSAAVPAASEAEPQQGELDMSLHEEAECGAVAQVGEECTRPAPITSSSAAIIDILRQPTGGHGVLASPASSASRFAASTHSVLGRRSPQLPVERIVSLLVMARDAQLFHGPDLVVAAEKTGMEWGVMAIYHRLAPGKREQGAVFSMANMLKPGSFNPGQIERLRTPGVSFFMTLPTPVPALDAWEMMLPTAQRLAELLGGQVLDEQHNGLGRQRIASVRDELRSWDRRHEV